MNQGKMRLLVVGAAVLVVAGLASPSWAAGMGVSPHVGDALRTWEESVPAVHAAAREVKAAEATLGVARTAVAAAAAARDEAEERLRTNHSSQRTAEAALVDVRSAARAAEEDLQQAAVALEEARDALRSRSAESRGAATAAGPPVAEGSRARLREVRDELEKALARQEALAAEHGERLAEISAASDERVRLYAERPALQEVLDQAVAAAEAAGAEAVAAASAVEGRRQDLADRQAAHDAALAALRGLGWRAGVLGRGGLMWPTDGDPGSRFGTRRHPISGRVRLHAGVDVPAPTGQSVVAAADGTVAHAGVNGGYGFVVEIAHAGGRTTRYAHLSYISVRAGEQVTQGQRIGKVGSTGASTGPHLHFELWVDGKPRDPLDWFAGVVG